MIEVEVDAIIALLAPITWIALHNTDRDGEWCLHEARNGEQQARRWVNGKWEHRASTDDDYKSWKAQQW
jgi:hypothetical protein